MVDERIAEYTTKYPVAKWLLFIKDMIEAGWNIKVYEVRVSKYVFVYKENTMYKIRFSNHKPIYHRELENDCDFYAGVSNKNCLTTEEIKKRILETT
jgi:hypothetical protein